MPVTTLRLESKMKVSAPAESKNALIVVDLQKDFCKGGSLAVPNGDEIVPVVNILIEKFRKIRLLNSQAPIALSMDYHRTEHDGWPKHCIQGTQGVEFHPDLFVYPDMPIFVKGFRPYEGAYSGFQGIILNPCTKQPFSHPYYTYLEDWLHFIGVKRIFIAGLATDYCVKATAIDGAKKGFDLYVVTDAIAAVNIKPGNDQKAIQEMVDAGCKLCVSQDVLGKFLPL